MKKLFSTVLLKVYIFWLKRQCMKRYNSTPTTVALMEDDKFEEIVSKRPWWI